MVCVPFCPFGSLPFGIGDLLFERGDLIAAESGLLDPQPVELCPQVGELVVDVGEFASGTAQVTIARADIGLVELAGPLGEIEPERLTAGPGPLRLRHMARVGVVVVEEGRVLRAGGGPPRRHRERR